MFTLPQLEKILFLDIETASIVPTYAELPERLQGLWDRKASRLHKGEGEPDPAALFQERAGIFAEFGRVVCISCGYLQFDEQHKPSMRIKSYYGEDEHQILQQFGQMLDKYASDKPGRQLCAHNGKEFDFPYLGRRCVIHGLPLPEMLAVQGKKPWETSFIDTMELWKFGDYKAYTSLDLLTAILGIPSSKDDIDGSQVSHVYWVEKDHARIKTYCEKDVKVTAQVLLRMCRMPLMED